MQHLTRSTTRQNTHPPPPGNVHFNGYSRGLLGMLYEWLDVDLSQSIIEAKHPPSPPQHVDFKGYSGTLLGIT